MAHLNPEVTKFLDDLHHPLRAEIEQLRMIILHADSSLTENIKWNGPNYRVENNDCITMRIHPPKQVQIIFHRGAKKQAQPSANLINDASGLLLWKEHDRAVASFTHITNFEKYRPQLQAIVQKWIAATKSIH